MPADPNSAGQPPMPELRVRGLPCHGATVSTRHRPTELYSMSAQNKRGGPVSRVLYGGACGAHRLAARLDGAPPPVDVTAPTGAHHLSGPAVTGRLLQPTRRLELDSWTGRPPAARLCSWRGLPCRRRRRRRGGLLPHLFTLTGRRTAQPRAAGSMFSVALSVRGARRRHGPGVTRRHALMEPGLSSAGVAPRGRPAAVHRPASHFPSQRQ